MSRVGPALQCRRDRLTSPIKVIVWLSVHLCERVTSNYIERRHKYSLRTIYWANISIHARNKEMRRRHSCLRKHSRINTRHKWIPCPWKCPRSGGAPLPLASTERSWSGCVGSLVETGFTTNLTSSCPAVPGSKMMSGRGCCWWCSATTLA
jgi:hypothetical protein